jgi:hypothetical protein
VTEEEFDKALTGKMHMIRDNGMSILRPSAMVECGNGWFQAIHDLVLDLIALGWNGEVVQIKEKFGYLRFYIEQPFPCRECDNYGTVTGIGERVVPCGTCDGTDYHKIQQRITLAEMDSHQTCESCGADHRWQRHTHGPV